MRSGNPRTWYLGRTLNPYSGTCATEYYRLPCCTRILHRNRRWKFHVWKLVSSISWNSVNIYTTPFFEFCTIFYILLTVWENVDQAEIPTIFFKISHHFFWKFGHETFSLGLPSVILHSYIIGAHAACLSSVRILYELPWWTWVGSFHCTVLVCFLCNCVASKWLITRGTSGMVFILWTWRFKGRFKHGGGGARRKIWTGCRSLYFRDLKLLTQASHESDSILSLYLVLYSVWVRTSRRAPRQNWI